MRSTPAGTSSIELLESRIAPASFLVTNVLDDGSGGTLREAIDAANLDPATADTITFRADVTGVILLTAGIDIKGPLTIKGPGADKLVVSANGAAHVFFIDDGDIVPGKPLSLTTVSNLGLTDAIGGTNGGAINTKEPLTLLNVVVAKNAANEDGGGIYVDTPGKVSITGCKFLDNHAKNLGGGLFVQAEGGITISKTTFANNDLDPGGPYGGGLYLSAPTGLIVVKDSAFIGNDSFGTGEGGGLYLKEGTLTVSNTVFTGNGSNNGGGLGSASANVKITVTKSTFAYNKGSIGGGIYYQGDGTLTVSGSQFLHNSSVSDDGGAISLRSSSPALISGSIFSGNSSLASGGAISLSAGGSLTVKGSIFSANTASTKGGAIVGDFGGILTITGSRFLANSADDLGGAIATLGVTPITVTVTGTLFQQNSALVGGALSNEAGTWVIKTSRFLQNAALDGGGGGIFSLNSLTVTGSLFQGNSAHGDGGAVLLQGGSASLASSSFLENVALENMIPANGGAIAVFATSGDLTKLKITGNAASTGGGIYLNTSPIVPTAITYSRNYAISPEFANLYIV